MLAGRKVGGEDGGVAVEEAGFGDLRREVERAEDLRRGGRVVKMEGVCAVGCEYFGESFDVCDPADAGDVRIVGDGAETGEEQRRERGEGDHPAEPGGNRKSVKTAHVNRS